MIDITIHNDIQWGPGKKNEGTDFKVIASNLESNGFDVLIFTDSKGSSSEKAKKSWAELLFESYENLGLRVLLITRPKEMTVFFTLINFIQENKYRFNFLITNLGFVDLTPKKQSYIQDIIDQKPFIFNALHMAIVDLCEYQLNNGSIELLKTVNYTHFQTEISKFISTHFKQSYLIGVLEFDDNIRIDRIRPKHFFLQLKQSNIFIRRIAKSSSNISYLSPVLLEEMAPESISMDAVHLSEYGHQILYEFAFQTIVLIKQ
ncbi:MAG: hypothetical protein NTZ69_15415 [Bacteroidia bacterium]|nr:hypothetical protein [Bacteroidia bacterium]